MASVEPMTWVHFDKEYTIFDKKWSRLYYISTMLNRTQAMFEYKNLPDTINAADLETYLQVIGICCIGKYKNDLYAFFGGYGAECDAYGHPKTFLVTNAYLNFKHTFTLGVDGILMRNDKLRIGLLPMFNRYAQLMLETDISMGTALITTRANKIISAGDNNTKTAADKFIHDLICGKYCSILDNDLLKGIQVQDFGNNANSTIQSLIELTQYIKACWFNDIGLQANYNMKRSQINSDEAQMNDDALLPLVDVMINTRKEDIEKVNKLFGTNISIEFDSAWKIRKKLLDKAMTTDYNNSGDSVNLESENYKAGGD